MISKTPDAAAIPIAATVPILLAALLSFSPAAHARGAALEEVRLLSSTADGLEAEVSLPLPTVLPSMGHPGYHTVSLGDIPVAGEPGEPALARVSFWIAVPPGAAVAVSADASDELYWDGIRPLPVGRPEWIQPENREEAPAYRETFAESPAIYGGGTTFPAALASAGPESGLRYLRAVPVTIAPARWDPATGALAVARSVRVHVVFRGGAQKAAGRAIAGDDPSWERTYEGAVLNAAQARGWLRAPQRPAGARRIMAETTDLVKLEVKTSAIKAVSFADLEAKAWPGAGAPLSDLRLFEKFTDPSDVIGTSETETPIRIADSDGSGTWTDGDVFYFYGQNVYDRYPQVPWYVKRYGRTNVYWLGLRAGEANARMAEASSWLGRQDLTPVASYRWKEHFEEETEPVDGGVYMKMGAGPTGGSPPRPIDEESNIQGGVASVKTKHFYWIGGLPYVEGTTNWYTLAFDLPGFVSPLEFAARFQGVRHPQGSSVHRPSLYLITTPGGTDTVGFPRNPLVFGWEDSARYVASGADLNGMPLRERDNTFLHLQPVNGFGAALHWFEVAYMRAPRFVDGRVQIATGSALGPTEYRVTTAPAADLIAGFEVTDPRAPTFLTIDPAAQIEGGGQNRALRLQWDLAGTDRRFWIARSDRIDPPDAIVLDAPSDLTAPGDQDYVVILPRQWIPVIQPLLDHRQEQGHRVLLAPVEDVYDEFSGGRRWPHAVRSFLRALFATREQAPSYLLLVGDATEAFDNPIASSDPNWCPTQMIFSNSYTSYQGPELVSSDQWFVDNLTGDGERLDFLPDMHVGRLPAGSEAELQNMVSKILAYENFSPEDSWRNRVLFVSDDAWSSSITFDQGYTYNLGSESIFARSARLSRDVIETYGALADFGVDTFFVGQYMDSVPSLGRCVIDPNTGRCRRDATGKVVLVPAGTSSSWETNRDYGTQFVAPTLWQAMSRGHLFVSYNGHANARLMTHEYVFRHNPQVREDVRQLGNAGRPFVFMGYGCHLADFSGFEEKFYGAGDGIGENMMFLYPDRGGVGVIASTGYEWLDTTDKYNLAIVNAFFKNPPQYEGHTRWVLGEIVSRSKANVVAYGPSSPTYLSMSATYTLLGDPGLVMDAAPPRLAVTLDGNAIESGTPLVLPAASDSILIEARVRDEVWARSLTIQDRGGPVPPERYTVIPDTSDDRGFTARYRTTVFPQNYDIVLSAEDGTGRVAVASFPVRVALDLQLLRPGRDWSALQSGSLVLPEDSLRAVVGLPRFLAREDLQFLVDGEPILIRAVAQDEIDGKSRQWTLTVLQDLSNGRQRALSVRVAQPEGDPRIFPDTPVTIETNPGSYTYAIEELYNVPNPFGKETWVFYSLPAPADEVTMRIYTSSGKLIRTIRNLPAPQFLTDPPVRWDGRDEDGDEVANGLYFYKLSVNGPQGRLNRIEKMARVR